ncbi:hypothetical protein HDV00_008319 [Rhizophlyctis rosea]|nr:hypothetical protein HDV00_008319 [Rhizophlyctis rosea]
MQPQPQGASSSSHPPVGASPPATIQFLATPPPASLAGLEARILKLEGNESRVTKLLSKVMPPLQEMQSWRHGPAEATLKEHAASITKLQSTLEQTFQLTNTITKASIPFRFTPTADNGKPTVIVKETAASGFTISTVSNDLAVEDWTTGTCQTITLRGWWLSKSLVRHPENAP